MNGRFEKGNRAAARGKIIGPALARALAQYETDKCAAGQAARKIADKAIEMALDGDLDAIRWIADRTDGKPDQSIDVEVRCSARELSDDELAAIASAGSDGTADAPGSEE